MTAITWTYHGTHLVRELGNGATLELEPDLAGVQAWYRRPGRKPIGLGHFANEHEAREELGDIADGLEALWRTHEGVGMCRATDELEA